MPPRKDRIICFFPNPGGSSPTYYLGNSEGAAGPMGFLLDIPELFLNATATALIKNTIEWILQQQRPDGDFPEPDETDDELIQYCHGAPGVMVTMMKAYQIFGDTRYLQGADKASDLVWKTGLLVKGLMLCHGISGNSYMLAYLYSVTGNPKYLYRAIKFQEFVFSYPTLYDPSQMRYASPRYESFSTYYGSFPGAITLWADLLMNDPVTNSLHLLAWEPNM